MSTEYGEIKGIKIKLTEETWRELINMLEVAGNYYHWEP